MANRWLGLSAFVIVGCGGKVLEEPRGAGADVTVPSAGQEPASSVAADPGGLPQGVTARSEDPCATICERDGACGAGQTDCHQHCADDLRGRACALEATTYLRCYAENLEGCAALPPVCERAYCAYTVCAGKVVPSYCR